MPRIPLVFKWKRIIGWYSSQGFSDSWDHLDFLLHSSKVLRKECVSASEIPLRTTWWRRHCTINIEAAEQCGFPPRASLSPPAPTFLLRFPSGPRFHPLALDTHNTCQEAVRPELDTAHLNVVCSLFSDRPNSVCSSHLKIALEHFEDYLKLCILSLQHRSFSFESVRLLKVTYSFLTK